MAYPAMGYKRSELSAHWRLSCGAKPNMVFPGISAKPSWTRPERDVRVRRPDPRLSPSGGSGRFLGLILGLWSYDSRLGIPVLPRKGRFVPQLGGSPEFQS
jgi:hypothetical protein